MQETSEDLEALLKALADSTRLEIINILRTGAYNSEYLQNALNKSQSTISQHLKTLTQAGIIKFKKEGLKKLYYIRDEGIHKIISECNVFISKINKEKIDTLASKGRSGILS